MILPAAGLEKVVYMERESNIEMDFENWNAP